MSGTASSSAAVLPESSPLRRTPRAPRRDRDTDFYDRFEARALVYDAFWHADGARILLVGPPPLGLKQAYRAARYSARPSRANLVPRYHASESVMITELTGAPAGTGEIVFTIGGLDFPLLVRPNASGALAGRNIIFTMSKDNELAWIADWAGYHARRHGADAVLLFDNGSTRYQPEAIDAALRAVPGIARVAVHEWAFAYGAPDPKVVSNPFYTQFLQVSAMSVALRRYGAKAAGILNCDIDELVHTPAGKTVFSLATASSQGLVVFAGRFIEALPRPAATPPFRHADFGMRLGDPKARLSIPRKWALDPQRPWVTNLGVHPYMHWVRGRPAFSKAAPHDVWYWHFRGISTGWKDDRTQAAGLAAEALEVDEAWRAERDKT